MKNLFKHFAGVTLTLIAFIAFFSISTNSYGAYPGKKLNQTEQATTVTQGQELSVASLNLGELPSQSAGDDNTLLLVILALLLPPLAVYLYFDEWNKTCTLNLILTLLCGLPGVIHALIVILGKK